MKIPHRRDVIREFQGRIDKKLYMKAVMIGFVDDQDQAEAKIRKCLWLAAPITHPNGNRRWHDIIFRTDRGVLVNLSRISCNVCEDQKRITQYEECPRCEGAGCKTCRKTGMREGTIPCPQCAAKR